MIHIFKEQNGTYQVWSDCEPGEHKLGRCVACALHPHAALIEARKEVMADLQQIETFIKQVSPPILPSPD